METIWHFIQVCLFVGGVIYFWDLYNTVKNMEKQELKYVNRINELKDNLKSSYLRIEELKKQINLGCQNTHVIKKKFESKTWSIPLNVSKQDRYKPLIPELVVSKELYDSMTKCGEIKIGIFNPNFINLKNGDVLKWFGPNDEYYLKDDKGNFIVYDCPIKKHTKVYYIDEYEIQRGFHTVDVSKPRIKTITDINEVSPLYFDAKHLIHGAIGWSYKTFLNRTNEYYKNKLEKTPIVCYELTLTVKFYDIFPNSDDDVIEL